MPRPTPNIDLGLAVLRALAKPGSQFSHEEIAVWCDCTAQTILNIEGKALAKLKGALKRADLTEDDVD